MTGYVFIAFLALVVGYVFYMINVKSSYAWIGKTLEYSYVSIVFMILVPVMTMKVFADERHTKTDQMLFTAPVTVGQIVWGKYLAILTVFLVNVLIICMYPLFMADYGEIPFLASYSAIGGFFLMGAVYFAVGLFISSITENQIISCSRYICGNPAVIHDAVYDRNCAEQAYADRSCDRRIFCYSGSSLLYIVPKQCSQCIADFWNYRSCWNNWSYYSIFNQFIHV